MICLKHSFLCTVDSYCMVIIEIIMPPWYTYITLAYLHEGDIRVWWFIVYRISYEKNIWKTSASRQDVIAASRFILSLKYVLAKTHTHTHTHTQVYETMSSRQCTSSDNKQQYPKSGKHLRCVPCDYCYSLFLEKSFQLHRERMPRSSQVNYLTWGSRGEGLGARVHSTEYWLERKEMNRNGNTITCRECHSCIQHSTSIWGNYPRVGKEPSERFIGNGTQCWYRAENSASFHQPNRKNT